MLWLVKIKDIFKSEKNDTIEESKEDNDFVSEDKNKIAEIKQEKWYEKVLKFLKNFCKNIEKICFIL